MKKLLCRITVAAVLAVVFCRQSAMAQTITFESIPGGVPVDGMTISNQFLASHGVAFSLANGQSPVLAKVGLPRTAFQGYNLDADMPAPGQAVGTYFLTDDGVVSGPPSDLIISYATPVKAASGVILDVDGPEQWRIEAQNSATQVVDSLTFTAGDSNTGEGIATRWEFNRSTNDVHFIRLIYTTTGVGVGLAFDNFSPSSVSDPTKPQLSIYHAVEIGWNSVDGVSYQIQYSTELDPTDWQGLGSPILGNGTTNYVLDSIRDSSKKFYRVLLAE